MTFSLLFAAASAHAKDEQPNISQLAIDHPWHPREPSITEIELACGTRTRKFELRVDDRGWLHFIAPEWEVASTPFGRFIKGGAAWGKSSDADWLKPREGELSLRELIGSPILPDGWQVKSSSIAADGSVRAVLGDTAGRAHLMSFDEISGLWTFDRRGGAEWLRVVEKVRLGNRMFPAKITVTPGCTMLRKVRAARPPMPSRDVLEKR